MPYVELPTSPISGATPRADRSPAIGGLARLRQEPKQILQCVPGVLNIATANKAFINPKSVVE